MTDRMNQKAGLPSFNALKNAASSRRRKAWRQPLSGPGKRRAKKLNKPLLRWHTKPKTPGIPCIPA